MDVRLAQHEDLAAIEDVTHWACSEAIGEMVPEAVVSRCSQQRFRRSVLSEHLLSRRLLVGIGSAGRVELVAMIDDRTDHLELVTVVAPVHPSRILDGRDLVEALRSMGWEGPISSSVTLGDIVQERFHEMAGFAPGEVIVDRIAGHDLFRREWWLDPVLSAAG